MYEMSTRYSSDGSGIQAFLIYRPSVVPMTRSLGELVDKQGA